MLVRGRHKGSSLATTFPLVFFSSAGQSRMVRREFVPLRGQVWEYARLENPTERESRAVGVQTVEEEATLPDRKRIEERWADLSKRLCEEVKESSRVFMVLRARRIWGLLGQKLQEHSWCVKWRKKTLVPITIVTRIRRWIKPRVAR